MDRTGAARIGWNDLPPGHTSSLPSQAICRLQACLQVLYFSFSLRPATRALAAAVGTSQQAARSPRAATGADLKKLETSPLRNRWG